MEQLLDKVYGSLLGGLIGDAMGAPVEGWNWKDIKEKMGYVDTFEGAGTDDSAVKLIIIRVLLKNGGHITCDELAESFLENRQYYNLFFVPVRNMFHKLEENLALPIDAGRGNMQSSSSAMAISPMGIVNAGDPRQAALETFDVAGLIHSGPASFCRDGACAMAAAVAQALVPGASVDEVTAAATKYLHPKSSALMIQLVEASLCRARELGSYEAFREDYYDHNLRSIISDSRETIPATLALFQLSGGDPVKAVEYGANFGRDADTIASMTGAIAGAFAGASALKKEWVEAIEACGDEQMKLAEGLTDIIRQRGREAARIAALRA